MKTINTLGQLKKLAKDKDFECKMLLNGGVFSRKTITFHNKPGVKFNWKIINHIDESVSYCSSDFLFKKQNPLILQAMKNNALIY